MNLKEFSGFQERAKAILECIEENSKTCIDTITKNKEIFYNEGYSINNVGVDIDQHAESQLLNFLRIPISYFHRCDSNLKRINFNYWIEKGKARDFTIRWKEARVRAIFSSRYSNEMDDKNLIPFILETIKNSANIEDLDNKYHIKDFENPGDFTRLKILFKDLKTDYEGSPYIAGFSITNSEVGKSAMCIKPLVRFGNKDEGYFDLIDKVKEGSVYIRHMGEFNKDKILEGLNQSRKVAQVGIYRILEAEKEIVKNPNEEIKKFIENGDFLTESIAQMLEEEYKEKQEATRICIVKSMLNAVKNLPLFEKHIAECEIGRFINLFGDIEDKIKDINLDIKKVFVTETKE